MAHDTQHTDMPAPTGPGGDCGKPTCERPAEETYEGPQGNTIRLCGTCYYRLVTRGRSLSDVPGLGTDIPLEQMPDPPETRLGTGSGDMGDTPRSITDLIEGTPTGTRPEPPYKCPSTFGPVD